MRISGQPQGGGKERNIYEKDNQDKQKERERKRERERL